MSSQSSMSDLSQDTSMSDLSQGSNDLSPDSKRARVGTYDSDNSQGSNDSGWGTVKSANDPFTTIPFPEPNRPPILKPTSGSKAVNTAMPPNPISKAQVELKRKANRDERWSRENEAVSSDTGYVSDRRRQNGPNNEEARNRFIQSDAELRKEIIEMFEQWEKDNPPADAIVRFDESNNTVGRAKRESMGTDVLTVKEDRREKSNKVADKVSDILFDLLKFTPPEQLDKKMNEIIDKASPVNRSLNNSGELTSRHIQHLYNADLFEKAIEMTLIKLNSHKMSYTGQFVLYTKDIINSIKDRLYSWVFGGASVGGYSSIKTQTKRRRKRSIKRRSKKSKRSNKRIRSNKSKKRI